MNAPTRYLSLSWQLVLRNIAFQRTAWVALVSAFLEPAMYFTAVVVGFGHIVNNLDPRAYVAFAGPALLAVSVMNGSIVECTNNVFYRLRQARLYDTVICTAMSPGNVALGELIYGTLRGLVYGAIFLLLLYPFIAISLVATIACLAAAVPVGWMFAALGLSLVSRLTSWRQLQTVQLAVFVMFLVSDTFTDVTGHGEWFNVLVHLFPLTYANHLMRAIIAQDWSIAATQLSIVLGVAVVLTTIAITLISRELSD